MSELKLPRKLYTKRTFYQWLTENKIVIHYRTMLNMIKESCGYYDDPEALADWQKRKRLKNEEINKFISDWL